MQIRGKYLYKSEKPFFWLGDTAWLLYENLEEDEIKTYIKNRAGLGYNVLQTVLFYSLPNKNSIVSGMPVKGKNIFCEEYFSLVDRVFTIADRYGIYIALLPCWGSYVKEKVLKIQDIDRFTDFLVKRFAHHENLIWVLGGDVKGDENLELFNKFGETLKKKDSHLVTFHPFGRTLSSRWFNGENWCDFNMFQSGHRRYDQARLKAWDDQPEKYYGEDNWKYVEENFSYVPAKPCLDAEPSYEGIVQGLHDPAEPYWEACDVRRYAYWSVFAGACGFTYGNNAIIQFYTEELGKGAYGIRESWRDALHAEGGAELKYLKDLFEDFNFTNGCPREDLLISPQRERYHRISVFAGENYILAYDYCGDEFEISLKHFDNKKAEAYWLNPQNGAQSYIGEVNGDTACFRPAKRRELSNDWVLILKAV